MNECKIDFDLIREDIAHWQAGATVDTAGAVARWVTPLLAALYEVGEVAARESSRLGCPVDTGLEDGCESCVVLSRVQAAIRLSPPCDFAARKAVPNV